MPQSIDPPPNIYERTGSAPALLRIAGRVARLGGWTIQLPERVLTWSDETCAIHDLPPGATPTLEEGICYYPPEHRDEVRRRDGACATDGTPYDFEMPKVTATGRRIWVRSIGEAVRDDEGNIVRLQGAFQDISDRKAAEETLRESETELRTLTESMPQIVWMARPDGQNIYFNHRWMEFTGEHPDESRGLDWIGRMHPDDRARLWSGWHAATAARTPFTIECRLRGADGLHRWMLMRGVPFHDRAGQVTKWIGTCTDIDSLKQAQEAAQEAEQVQRQLAAQLETERARLVAAQAVASVGSWENDPLTHAVNWSAETYRIFEIPASRTSLTDDDVLELIHPDDRGAVTAALAQSLESDAPCAIEHRLLMPDGRTKFIAERWQVIRDTAGRALRTLGTCQDVTEHRRAHEAIRVQAQMLDQIGQAVIATDVAGLITYANRFAGELYGWPPKDMVGRMMTDVTVPQVTREQGEEIMARLGRGETWSGDFLVQRRGGRTFPVHVTDSPITSAAGDLTGIIGISTDISARRRAEEEMRHKDALIRIAGRVTHTGGWALDMPGQRLFWSDEVFDMLDYPRGGMPSLSEALALYPEPGREKIAAALTACARNGTPIDMEVEILTATGGCKWVRVCAEADRDERGAVRRVEGAVQDITDRKQLEQQFMRSQRMESIGALAGGIAHDLNNVLTPILLSTSLLQQGERDPARLETLAAIEASATRGAEMVSHVLSFARGLEGHRAEVQVRPLVADLAKIVRDTFPKNIRFEERLGAALWPVQADATQIHQVLINLCVNARDAMPDGGQIVVGAENVVVDEQAAALNLDAHAGPHVKIEIADTGTGIPGGIIHKIFDPFFTTKAIGKGTGLGLATSLVIVKSHGGFVEVHSEPGAGTRFCLYLPALATGAAGPPAATQVVFPRGNGETVLVIDDEALIRRIATRTLEACGYRVLVAADGREGVAIYAQHQPDIAVVITDMMMPVMDGLATIRALVRLNPGVRIIGASGLAEDRDLAAVGGVNLTHFLAKPYTAASLLDAIHTVLTGAADIAHAPG